MNTLTIPQAKQFIDAVQSALEAHPYLRLGQAMFNVLEGQRPKLANMVRGSIADPFYNNKNIKAFLHFIASPDAYILLKQTYAKDII